MGNPIWASKWAFSHCPEWIMVGLPSNREIPISFANISERLPMSLEVGWEWAGACACAGTLYSQQISCCKHTSDNSEMAPQRHRSQDLGLKIPSVYADVGALVPGVNTLRQTCESKICLSFFVFVLFAFLFQVFCKCRVFLRQLGENCAS